CNGDRTVRLAGGLADVARKRAMQPGNHFKIASLTKSYTATVVLQLVGEGKLSLDDTVEQRLPGVVPNGGKITIHELLNHTSRIFQPLHLRHTTYPTKPGLPSPYAHGYYRAGKPPAIDISGLSPSLSPASGAIVSTAADVADFYRALLSGRLLTHDLLQAMKKT